MKIIKAEHVITAVKPEQYPATGFQEVAFVGRSNVGKSSIINTLTNRKNLARVGATPGKTRQINFFNINDEFYLVDLPGYGYASVSKDMKASWHKIIETYLYKRAALELSVVLLLVDIRHDPTKDDLMMLQWLNGYGIETLVVATKADKLSRSQIKPRLSAIKKVLGLNEKEVIIPFSSEARTGIDEVWQAVFSHFEMEEDEPEVLDGADTQKVTEVHGSEIDQDSAQLKGSQLDQDSAQVQGSPKEQSVPEVENEQ